MAYRDDLTALAARRSALADELAQKSEELAEATRLLDEATARRRLPVLENIRIAAPCSADWSAMTGDDRARHCGACDKQVFNLSNMTRDEAQALIVEKAGKLCARYYQRTDGTILLADCTVGVAQRRNRNLIAAGAAVMLAGAGILAARPAPISQATLPEMRLPTDAKEHVDVRATADRPDTAAHGLTDYSVLSGDISFAPDE